MELAKLITIYGKPVVSECPNCNGEGCINCNHFGFLAVSNNKNISYTFKYPLVIKLKERMRVDFIRKTLIGFITLLFLLVIITSYILNFQIKG